MLLIDQVEIILVIVIFQIQLCLTRGFGCIGLHDKVFVLEQFAILHVPLKLIFPDFPDFSLNGNTSVIAHFDKRSV